MRCFGEELGSDSEIMSILVVPCRVPSVRHSSVLGWGSEGRKVGEKEGEVGVEIVGEKEGKENTVGDVVREEGEEGEKGEGGEEEREEDEEDGEEVEEKERGEEGVGEAMQMMPAKSFNVWTGFRLSRNRGSKSGS